MKKADRRAGPLDYALLLVLATLWGSSYLFARVAVQEIPPLTMVAARVLIAAMFLLALLALRAESLPRDWASWRLMLAQAFLGNIAAWVVLAWGQQFIDAGLASVLNSTSPLFVFLIALALGDREGKGWRRGLGAMIGLAGVVLVIGVEALDGLGREVAAQGAALLSAFFYGCAALYGRRLSHLTPSAAAAGAMVWASLVLVPLAVVADQPWRLSPSPVAIGSTLILGVFCTGAALAIYFRLIKRSAPWASPAKPISGPPLAFFLARRS